MTDINYIRAQSENGMAEKFPMSRHVLSLPPLKLKKIDLWRPSLLQQASAFLLVVCLFASSYGVTYGKLQSTIAYFRDDETSRNNVLAAGALDFVVSPDGSIDAIVEEGEKILLPVMTPEPGTFPTMYRVTASTTEPLSPLCIELDAVATTSPFIYSGSLLALAVTATTTTGTWPLEISLPDATGLVDGVECEIEIVYRGWHKDVPENTGYTDEERFKITFTYGESPIVLNEFLPNPAGAFGEDGDSKPLGEWAEIYNNGDDPVDLENWYVWDDSGNNANKIVIADANTHTGSTVIPGHGFLVVYFNMALLDNDEDDVRLYHSSDALMDSHSYAAQDLCEPDPTPGDPNDGEPCPTEVPENKSYARIPDGIGNWVDPIPTPGAPNIPDPEPVPEPEVMGAETSNENGSGDAAPVPEETATSTPETEKEDADAPQEPAVPEVGNWSSSGNSSSPSPEETETDVPQESTDGTAGDHPAEDPPPADDAPPATENTPADEPQPEPEPEPAAEPSPPPEVPEEQGDAAPSTEPPAPVDTPPPPPEPESPPPPADVPASE